MTTRRAALSVAASVGLLALGVLAASERLVSTRVVVGGSMEPTLRAGDRVLVDRWTYRHRPARVGEVVLVSGPEGLPMIKRVHRGVRSETGTRTASAATGIWVLGDNADDSEDSRHFGALPAGRLRGRVVWRYWPPSRVGPVRPAFPSTAGPGRPPAPPTRYPSRSSVTKR